MYSEDGFNKVMVKYITCFCSLFGTALYQTDYDHYQCCHDSLSQSDTLIGRRDNAGTVFSQCVTIKINKNETCDVDTCRQVACPPSHLFVLLQLRVVDLSDLGQLGSVVRVLRRVVRPRSSRGRRRRRSSRRASAFLRTGHALRQQHVVQPHELGIRGLLLLGAADTQHCKDRRRSEVSGERSRLERRDAA